VPVPLQGSSMVLELATDPAHRVEGSAQYRNIINPFASADGVLKEPQGGLVFALRAERDRLDPPVPESIRHHLEGGLGEVPKDLKGVVRVAPPGVDAPENPAPGALEEG